MYLSPQAPTSVQVFHLTKAKMVFNGQYSNFLTLSSFILHFDISYFQPHRKTSTGAKKQEQLAQFPVAHNPRIQEVLKPQSASAPNSPRLSHRALPITVTSSATVKVASPSPTTNTSQNKSRKPQEDKLKAEPITRKRSKSPVPRR